MARGDRREAIFFDDRDRTGFLDALGEACQRTGWKYARIHADDQPLSLGHTNAGTQLGDRHGMASKHLHPALQYTA